MYFGQDETNAHERLNTGNFQWFNLNVIQKNGTTLVADTASKNTV